MALKIFALDPPSTPPKWWWWLFVGAMTAALLLMPEYLELYVIIDLTSYFIFALLALSMSFLWGYCGVLSFGQTAFFGLGGYGYTVLALNTGETTGSIFFAIALPMIFSAIVGYFMIYGRISDIYLSVITLVVTLILEKGVRATSGDQYVIGSVRLNGQNGIPTVPALKVPWNTAMEFSFEGFFQLAVVLMLLTYVGLRMLLLTKYGRVLVSIRENERRTELLGYDARKYKLSAFVLAGGIAGLSGAMFAIWGPLAHPQMFGLGRAADVIIWVLVGGKATLIGPIAGAVGIEYLKVWLGTQGVGQVPFVLGLVLMLFVLLFQQGVLPSTGLVLAYVRNNLSARWAERRK